MIGEVLTELDKTLGDAEETVEAAGHAVRAARAHRARVEELQRAAAGRAVAGDRAAGAELEVLREKFLAARRAEQDAAVAVSAARAKVGQLRRARGRAEQAVTREHLAGLLDVRLALARHVDAELDRLAGLIASYQAVVSESVQLAALVPGVPALRHRTMSPFVARQVLARLRPAVGEDLPAPPGPEPWRLAEGDADVVRPLMALLSREGAEVAR
jgi:hypothetical protein